jgi:NAD(P)-dependent dehydrogenase (short-subunit alcohol dehydrogenase family)
VALVTSTNRGLGKVFSRALLAADAAKGYVGARRPESLRIVGVQPVKLDHTNIDDVETAVAHCSAVTLVINNAGIAPSGGFLGADGIATSRAAFEANFFGTLEMCCGFAPVLKCNGGGVIGTFAGYQARTRLVNGLKVKDIFIAIPEDLVAIGLGYFLVSLG